MTDEMTGRPIPEILRMMPHMSVAEARALSEGRPLNPVRDTTTYAQSLQEITDAIVREFGHNVDVGELIVGAVNAASREVIESGAGSYLTQNRPGSWEASLVERLIQRD